MVPSSGSPRSLTQMLRDSDDSALCELLLSRPDLASGVPTEFSQLASQATTRHSVSAALDSLTAFELWVVDRACAVSQPFAATDLATGVVDPMPLTDAVQRLRRLSLVWGQPDELRPVRALSALMAQRDLAEPVEPTPPAATPPSLESAPTQSPSLVNKVAAGSAFEFVRRMDVLVEHCDHRPLRLTRDGALSSRDLRILAGLLDVPTAAANAHLQIAQAADLLGRGEGDLAAVLIPTGQFDRWHRLPLATQWQQLFTTWLRDHRQSGPRWLKNLCLQAFGDPADGRVLSVEEVRAWLAWHRPRRPQGTDRQATTLLDQAAWIGVTGLGARSAFAADPDASGLDELLPPRVGHVIIQADLTAVAPGPLTPEAAADLAAVADVESRGGATVYRLSADSLRRAHMHGWSVDAVLDVLATRSSTPLPQALTYLVHDLDRQSPNPPANTEPSGPPPRAAATSRGDDSGVPDVDLEAARRIVAGLRAIEPLGPSDDRSGSPPGDMAGVVPVDTLREAVESGEVVWFGYVDRVGTAAERLVRATAVDDGRLSAVDAHTRKPFEVALHRITAAHIIRGA